MTTPGRVIRWLLSSLWLRLAAANFVVLAAFLWGLSAVAGEWSKRPDLTPFARFTLIFMGGGAALELWLQTNSAKAILAPIAARLDKSRVWRELNKPGPIAGSVTLTVIVHMLLVEGMLALILAAVGIISNGFSGVIDVFLFGWWIFAVIAGMGTLGLILHHAGIDPARAVDRLFWVGCIGGVGFVAGMIYPELGSQYSREAQRSFHKTILSAPAPCLAVQDKLSNLSSCTVFRLRPGMTQSEALDIVNGSGYFRNKEKPVTCKPGDKCSHSIYSIKDGLYLSLKFETDPKSATPEVRVSSIVLSLDEGTNPYFDESQMLAAFLKLIGPNGSSVGDTHTVWIDIKNDLELHAYTYDNKFWAVFERIADRPNRPGSGIPV